MIMRMIKWLMLGVYVGLTAFLILVAIAFFWAAESRAGDLHCKETIWGTTLCQERGGGRYTLSQNIWGNKEIKAQGQVVVRCRDTIWDTTVCKAK